MTTYIVCQKRRNSPRMDIRVCTAKCRRKDGCQEYVQHTQSPRPTGNRALPIPLATHPPVPHQPEVPA